MVAGARPSLEEHNGRDGSLSHKACHSLHFLVRCGKSVGNLGTSTKIRKYIKPTCSIPGMLAHNPAYTSNRSHLANPFSGKAHFSHPSISISEQMDLTSSLVRCVVGRAVSARSWVHWAMTLAGEHA